MQCSNDFRKLWVDDELSGQNLHTADIWEIVFWRCQGRMCNTKYTHKIWRWCFVCYHCCWCYFGRCIVISVCLIHFLIHTSFTWQIYIIYLWGNRTYSWTLSLQTTITFSNYMSNASLSLKAVKITITLKFITRFLTAEQMKACCEVLFRLFCMLFPFWLCFQ